MGDHRLLRVSAALLLIGEVALAVASVLHPAGGSTFEASFANYAASGNWAAVHLAQFVATAIFLGGLLALFFALDLPAGLPRCVGFSGAITAVVTLAFAGVLYAVNGVALKQAVDVWASAPAAEKGTSYASVLAIRWVEWGTDSYQLLMSGLALVLVATVIIRTARIPRPIGCLMGLAGVAWLVWAWLVGTRAFNSADTLPTYAGQVFVTAVDDLALRGGVADEGAGPGRQREGGGSLAPT